MYLLSIIISFGHWHLTRCLFRLHSIRHCLVRLWIEFVLHYALQFKVGIDFLRRNHIFWNFYFKKVRGDKPLRYVITLRTDNNGDHDPFVQTTNCTACWSVVSTMSRRMWESTVRLWFYHGSDPYYFAWNSRIPDQHLFRNQKRSKSH